VSPLNRRLAITFFSSLAVVVGADLLWLLLRLAGVSWAAPLPVWLPEDAFWGFLLQWAHDLLSWIPALGLSSLMLTVAFQWSPMEVPDTPAKATRQVGSLAVFLSVFVAILTLWILPLTDAALDKFGFRDQQTRSLENAYFALKNLGSNKQTSVEIQERLNLLQRLGQLRPNQSQQTGERMDYDFELQILKARIDLDTFFRLHALSETPEESQETSWTLEQLIGHAEASLAAQNGDEFRANLWGLMAYRRIVNALEQGLTVDSALLERAKQVVQKSWSKVYAKTLSNDERKKASYFFRKGTSLGDFHFQNYLEAYYGFQELHRENPDDAEVTQHLSISQQKVSQTVLFRQDMDVLFHVPGLNNVIFVNRDHPLEIVRIGRMLGTDRGVYVKDFEFLRLADDGSVALHWIGPYGRWTSSGIDFRVWDKEAPIPSFPHVLTQTPGNEFPMRNSVEPAIFMPQVTPDDLDALQTAKQKAQMLPSFELLVHGKSIQALGYNPVLFQTEFLLRWTAPLAYFVGVLFLFLLAWHTRTTTTNRTWWLLVPTLPLLAEFLVQTTAWVSRLAVGGLLVLSGLETVLLVLAGAFVVSATIGVGKIYQSLTHR